MNNDEKKALALAAADFLITYQLHILRLTAADSNTSLSIPTVEGITEEDLTQILSDKFSPDSATFEFEYIKKSAMANGTTIIYINR